MARLHIVGAGLSGLAAAIEASQPGARGRWTDIRVHEATAHAGGRCRSYHDAHLDRFIDNGNHLLLGGNKAAFRYLDQIGARDSVAVVRPAAIPFLDLRTGERWTLAPNRGPLPWWLVAPGRTMPGFGLGDVARLVGLCLRPGNATVAERIGRTSGDAYERFWDPMVTAVLNTAPSEASARLTASTLAKIVAAGEPGFRPCIARDGLGPALVAPALRRLAERDVEVEFANRLRGLEIAGGRVARLVFDGTTVALGADDVAVLALPAEAVTRLLPDLRLPRAFSSIVNLHFRTPEPIALPGGLPLLGLVGGTAQWVFVRGDILSVTISAAAGLVDRPAAVIAGQVSADLEAVLPPAMRGRELPWRVLKERRATILQTPEAEACKPGLRPGPENLLLAGDWIEPNMPATIEAALASGRRAARIAARI